MKTAVPLILVLTAAPAFAGGLPIFLGHRDPEYRGVVSQWPEVRRAREIERLCPAQQFAIYWADKRALEAASPSLYRPNYTTVTAPTATRSAEPAPAPPPPPPTVPSEASPTARPSTPAEDRPAAPRAGSPPAPGATSPR